LEKLAQHIEALIFAADSPITFDEIQSCLEEAFGLSFSHDEVENAIQQVIARYGQEEYAIEVIEIGGGYQFMSKGSFHPSIAVWLKQTTRKRLSQAALETLSIIAYKQPVTKNEIELIRGVNCDYTLQKLLEKELVSITGRSEGPGRPLLYGTSSRFMDYFGLKNLNDLPKLKDFREPENEAGERTPIEETREEQ
jgi:segregation and condensation protein B